VYLRGCIIPALVVVACMSASGAYVTDFTSPTVSSDFQYAQIGQQGTDGAGAHNFILWDDANGYVRLSSRYYQPVSRILIRGGDADNGVMNAAGDATFVSMTYRYFNGDTFNAFAQVALHAAKSSGANNYPVYWAQVRTNTFTIWRQQVFDSSLTAVATYNLPTTLSAGSFELRLSGQNTGGSTMQLQSTFYQDGNLIASLSYTDAAGFLSGYAGFAGGDGFNTANIRGIEILNFSAGNVIPEPSSAILMILGVAVLRRIWRSRR